MCIPYLRLVDAPISRRTKGGEKMETSVQNTETLEVPEQRLWRAVLANALQEWIHGPLRKKREAEQFLFQDNDDYRAVCSSAGIDPAHLRHRLLKIQAGTGFAAIAAASRN
jgi:hypothetical protein